MNTPDPTYSLARISKVIDPDRYEVELCIPGVIEGVKAFPMRGEVDEPKPGDLVLCIGLDPVYHSVYFYQCLKENEYIGFRSRGKKVDITKDRIEIGIFPETQDPEATDAPYPENETPESTSWIKIDADGNLDIMAEGNQTVNIMGDSKVNIQGASEVTIGGEAKVDITGKATVCVNSDVSLDVTGNANISVSGSVKLDSPTVTITGGGTLETKGGSVAPQGVGGFCAIPVCPFSGSPHTGTQITGI